MSLNRSWLLARRPEGAVQTNDFAYHEEAFEAPRLDEGEILVRTRIISCAPTIRNWLNSPERSYRGAIGIVNRSRAWQQSKCWRRVMRGFKPDNGPRPWRPGRIMQSYAPMRQSSRSRLSRRGWTRSTP